MGYGVVLNEYPGILLIVKAAQEFASGGVG